MSLRYIGNELDLWASAEGGRVVGPAVFASMSLEMFLKLALGFEPTFHIIELV
jgi:hypothetical protein